MIQVALLAAGGFALGDLARAEHWHTLGYAGGAAVITAILYAVATKDEP